ncbi:hypothetical protein PSTG_19947 [Puccinia striiformis f. sp. tritici PST-78]|uniref:Uncharacterized protein n=1 Tax=Puccinia striiformis f. sp. tritici PST-78 TaxID=1165861 RepID=A0A0L0UIY7_9BASI|nr:hypothetical protein PSTG_19947 [Puccinia striiformis f. sp. tritici PST-78]
MASPHNMIDGVPQERPSRTRTAQRFAASPTERRRDSSQVFGRFSKVHRNIPNIHPAAVIAAFQYNVRNRRIRSNMNVQLPKTVKELCTLEDICARMEEGRKLPREEDCVDIDSEDDD